MNNSIFVDSIFNDKIKVPAKYIAKNKNEYILNSLKKLENICSKNGYIKKGSIQILSVSMGIIEQISLLGSVNYIVKYKCLICNPIDGCIITAKVENFNQFGLLCTVKNDDMSNIIEIVIPKKSSSVKSDVELDTKSIGDVVSVKLLRNRFHINDQNITGVGIIVNVEPTESIAINLENNLENNLINSTILDDTESIIDDDDIEIDDEDEDDDENELTKYNENVIIPTKKISDIANGKPIDDDADVDEEESDDDIDDDVDDDIEVDDSDNDD